MNDKERMFAGKLCSSFKVDSQWKEIYVGSFARLRRTSKEIGKSSIGNIWKIGIVISKF